jgi:hypothetical protein
MDDLRKGNVRPGGAPLTAGEFAGTAREILAAFYRREFLKTARATPGGRPPLGRLGGLLRNAIELFLLPGAPWAPQIGTRGYYRTLEERASVLRRALADHLELRLARAVAGAPADSRRDEWVRGMREIRAAFGEG